MITGREFSSETINTLEEQNINDFYYSDHSLLSDALNYYGILFTTFLMTHGDKRFDELSNEEKKKIIDRELSKFRNAMIYSFNKGHQMGFTLLLKKESQEFDPSFFTMPEAHDDFIYTYERMVKPSVFNINIERDAIDRFIKDTRKHFENGYKEITELGTRFFKKGIGVAFEQVRQKVLNVDYKITGRSKMLEVPFNQSFTVTPSFKATFSLESPNYEEWDLHWDETYGFNAAKGIIAKVMIHRLRMSEIKKYNNARAQVYSMLYNFVNKEFQDDEEIYLARLDFLVTDTEDFPRLLEKSEYNAIKLSLKQTICRRLEIDGHHLFITN